ncbi:MAG: flavodoxin family protein [candidate division Zixibacteria bacterium]|nr:flavodoxin family protein [candidate division Zixibacteria bacterium]MDH3937270.1 flavodoxin family protein [candidate division Zixibacteria bacterium]
MTTEKPTPRRVLGIVGSPRPGGNTDLLVDEVLNAAANEGASVEKVHLSKLTIAPCTACEGCKTKGHCIVDDDLGQVLDRMNDSDIWVLGTPVYFWGPTAWLKAFIDRWYGSRQYVDFASKRAIVVVPLEDNKDATARHTVGMLKDTLEYTKTELVATIVAKGVNKKGEVNDHPDYLEAARRAGQLAVTTLSGAG